MYGPISAVDRNVIGYVASNGNGLDELLHAY